MAKFTLCVNYVGCMEDQVTAYSEELSKAQGLAGLLFEQACTQCIGSWDSDDSDTLSEIIKDLVLDIGAKSSITKFFYPNSAVLVSVSYE